MRKHGFNDPLLPLTKMELQARKLSLLNSCPQEANWGECVEGPAPTCHGPGTAKCIDLLGITVNYEHRVQCGRAQGPKRGQQGATPSSQRLAHSLPVLGELQGGSSFHFQHSHRCPRPSPTRETEKRQSFSEFLEGHHQTALARPGRDQWDTAGSVRWQLQPHPPTLIHGLIGGRSLSLN